MKVFHRRVLLIAFALAFAVTAGFAQARNTGLKAPASAATRVLFGFGDDAPPPEQENPKVHEIHDQASFAKKTKSFSMMPYNKADLEFEIYLPSDWTPEEKAFSDANLAIGEKIAGEVARFWSPMIVTQRAYASIDVLKLDHEISARNWLKNYLVSSGYLLQGDVTEINNKSSTARYIRATDTGSNFGYISARISGGFVETARFEVPVNLKDYLKFLQKKSVDSFKLLYPKEEPIEEQKVFTLVDAMKFTYPASWKVGNPDFRDMNRLIVEAKNIRAGSGLGKGQIVDGYIRFLAVRRTRTTDLMTEVEEIKKFFNETMSLEFTKMLSSGKSDAYERFIFNRYEVYDVLGKAGKTKVTQELHLVVLGDKEWYVIAFLFTPKESAGLYNWARNIQSFQEMIKSIK
jgi:hypothetical protein